MSNPAILEAFPATQEHSLAETPAGLPTYLMPSFTCFPKLPKELQLKIYQFMLPGARHVHLTFKKRDTTRLGSKTAIPTLLHLCRDAREEALKTYQLCFGTDKHEPNVYFNFGIDTLYFGQVAQFGVEAKGRWFWQYDVVNRYRQIGCGRYEFKFFMAHVAQHCKEKLQFLTISAHIIRYEEDLVKKLSTLLALKRLSLSYSSTDVDVRRLHSADHGHNLRLLLAEMLESVKEENIKWICPPWAVECRSMNGEEEVGQLEQNQFV